MIVDRAFERPMAYGLLFDVKCIVFENAEADICFHLTLGTLNIYYKLLLSIYQ